MTTPGHGLPAWVQDLKRYCRSTWGNLYTRHEIHPSFLVSHDEWVKWADLVAACPPQEERTAFLLEALCAARDTLVAFQKQAGYLPEQQAYSTRMTDGEMQLSRAVADLDRIITAAALPGAVPARVEENTNDLSRKHPTEQQP